MCILSWCIFHLLLQEARARINVAAECPTFKSFGREIRMTSSMTSARCHRLKNFANPMHVLQCSQTCGRGFRRRSVMCSGQTPDRRWKVLPSAKCKNIANQPTVEQLEEECQLAACSPSFSDDSAFHARWFTSVWRQVGTTNLNYFSGNGMSHSLIGRANWTRFYCQSEVFKNRSSFLVAFDYL